MINLVCNNANAIKDSQDVDGFILPLMDQYKALNSQLKNNQFKKPLVLQSAENADALSGEIYTVLDYPFEQVYSAINNPNHWCDVLILHINVKYCRAENNNAGTILIINLGKKYEQPLLETYKAKFNYKSITNAANYFSVEMKADEGPLGTKDYRIWVEATPVNQKQTFLHFTYGYSFGLTSRLAMKGYLATIGKNKVGFSQETNPKTNQLNFISGVRGVVERNTMRYYLAIDAYLAALNTNESGQFEKRLAYCFKSTEKYAVQLHEMDRNEYVDMKRNEAERQRNSK